MKRPFALALLLALTTAAQAQKLEGANLVFISTSPLSREFSFDFSTTYTIPAQFPQPSRILSVQVDCPIQDSSRLFSISETGDDELFKQTMKPTVLKNGIGVDGWQATCDGGKLTFKDQSFQQLTKRLEINNINNNPLLMVLRPAMIFQNGGKSLLLQGGNLVLDAGKITGEVTGGAASIAVKQGDGPVQPVLLETKETTATVDFKKPFLIAHSNEGGKLWRNYLIDMPNASITLWYSAKDIGGTPLPRRP